MTDKAIEAAMDAFDRAHAQPGISSLDAMHAAAIAVYEAALWQPMESAPKDREILILSAWGTVMTARWEADEFAKKPNPYWCAHYSLGKTWNRQLAPTRWRPLPPPPKDKGND